MSPNTTTTIYAGLDIAKSNLQLHLAGQFHDLPNSAAGHRRLLNLLAAHSAVHVICEATGGYERDVVAALHAAQRSLSVLNPAPVRNCSTRWSPNASRPNGSPCRCCADKPKAWCDDWNGIWRRSKAG